MKPIEQILNDKISDRCKYCISEVINGGDCYIENGIVYCSAPTRFREQIKGSDICTIYDWAKCPYNEDK
jgi:hypothetical protein